MLPKKNKRHEKFLKEFTLGAVFIIALFLFTFINNIPNVSISKIKPVVAGTSVIAEEAESSSRVQVVTGTWTNYSGTKYNWTTGKIKINITSDNITIYTKFFNPSDGDSAKFYVDGVEKTLTSTSLGGESYKSTYNGQINSNVEIQATGGNFGVDKFEYTHNYSVAITANPTTVTQGGIVYFTSSVSDNIGGHATTYAWNFGDGGTSPSKDPSHIFNTPGTFNVILNASDSAGSDSKSKTITVNKSSSPPPPPPPPPPTTCSTNCGTTNGTTGGTVIATPIPPIEETVFEEESTTSDLAAVSIDSVEIDGKQIPPEDISTVSIFTNSKIKIIGTTEANLDLVVDLLNSDSSQRVFIYSVSANEEGKFEFTLDQELFAGNYSLYIVPAGVGINSLDYAPKLQFSAIEKGFEGAADKTKTSKFWQFVLAILKVIGYLIFILVVVGATGFGILWLVSKIKQPLETMIELKVDASKKKAVADGKDEVELYVHVATISPSDQKSLASGAQVSFEITGVENNLKQLDQSTNNDGTAKALLTSTSPGTKLINVTVRIGKKTEMEKIIVEFKEPDTHINDPEEMDI